MNSSEVKKIAGLARIALTDPEIEKLKKQFADILAYIHQMDRIDLAGTEPMSHPFNVTNVFREDTVVPPLGEKTLECAPAKERGMVRVPQIIT